MKKWLVILVIIPCLALGQTNKVKVGELVPSFRIAMNNGTTKSIEDFRGENVLIVFFATWCGPCLRELPHIEKDLWNRHKNNESFKLLIIGREHNQTALNEFKERNGYSMPFYADEERMIFSKFADSIIPRSYLIDKNGYIRYATIGFSEASFSKLKDQINELLE